MNSEHPNLLRGLKRNLNQWKRGLLFTAALLIGLQSFALKAMAQEPKKVKVAYFISRQEQDPFWGPVVSFMRLGAKQLGVELQVFGAKDDHLKLVEDVKAATKSGFDALIVVDFKDKGPEIIKIAEEAKIPVFFENSGVVAPEIGAPREKYKYYIGEMLPDDVNGSLNLTKELLKQAKVAADGKIHAIGIEGQFKTGCSLQRVKGFNQAVADDKRVVMHQIVGADWEPEKAKAKALVLTKRYPEISMIWTASDGMALGVVDALKEMKLTPGKEIVTGGVDWTREGISAVKSGDLVASAGGHIFEGGWALVVLFDYFNGIDFAKTEGVNLRSQMAVINKENVAEYEKVLNQENWSRVDFKQFSKFYTPSLAKYDFSIQRVLAQMK